MGFDAEKFLKDFHRENPGCTPSAFLYGKTSDGRTSYDCVAEALLKNPKSATVLDLACGDGILLEILNKSKVPDLKLHGVDMSPGELEAARKRLQHTAIPILEGRAQELPFKDAQFDFIFCHLALMLMGEVEKVLSEIHRCLKPGGTFSAIIGGGFLRTPIMTRFAEIMTQIKAEDGVQGFANGLGDARIRSADAVGPFFKGYFPDVEVKELQINFADKPAPLMSFFTGTYEVALLSPQAREKLEQRLMEALNPLCDENGILKFPFNLRQITVKK